MSITKRITIDELQSSNVPEDSKRRVMAIRPVSKMG